ncbi:MAG TPA: hypothetical protein VFT59_00750, partial [Candidatus Saccharimonadales bacterium]|nr:hypothetical protein [Candidatus Saccharimonadales bacterium]
DSVSMPENLLFTRVKFPNIEHITIVAGEHSAERACFFAEMFFAGRAQIACHACADGIGDPERELRLLGDAKCTLQDMTAGDVSFLLRPPSPEGRLQSRWNELRFAHHDCPYWGELHP